MGDDYRKHLREICKKCGFTFGSHHGGFGDFPHNCCPGHESAMDWDKGPGTIFEHTGTYKEETKS